MKLPEIPTFHIKKSGSFSKHTKIIDFRTAVLLLLLPDLWLDREIVQLAVGSRFEKKNLNVPSKHQMNEPIGKHQM